MKVSTIGLDLAKSVFQVHGIDAAGGKTSGGSSGLARKAEMSNVRL